MRLTIIQDRLRVGGTERQSLHLAEAAAKAGHTVHLIVFRPGGVLFPANQPKDYRITVLQPWDTGLSLYAPGLIEAVDASLPELILCMGRTANCYAGWLQQQFRSVPVVSTLRTGKVLQPWHRWALARVSGVLVNTSWWAADLRRKGLAGKTIGVVPNALLSAPVSQCEGASLRAEEGLSAETVVLLQVAGFRRGKRQAELIRRLAKWNRKTPQVPWVLWLVGEGPQRTRCENLAESLRLVEQVRFFGYQADPSRFYAAADLALSVSREDSLPNFLIEAQSAGLPVIAEDFRGVGEAFDPGVSGVLVPTGGIVDFETALNNLVSDASRRRSMGEAAQRFAQERFSPSRQSESVLEFLDTVRRMF